VQGEGGLPWIIISTVPVRGTRLPHPDAEAKLGPLRSFTHPSPHTAH